MRVQVPDQQEALKAQVQVEQPPTRPIVEVSLVAALSDDKQHIYERCTHLNFKVGRLRMHMSF